MSDGKVRIVEVPWPRLGSGFTLLFETLAILQVKYQLLFFLIFRLMFLLSVAKITCLCQ